MRAMERGYGIEVPGSRDPAALRKPARYLVIIDAGGVATAMLFLESRELIAEFDAGTEEATQMMQGLVPSHGALGPEWDKALSGHGAAQRRAAVVYTLDV